MTQDVQDAIVILKTAMERVGCSTAMDDDERDITWYRLKNAIRHLAYPDRDIYPKTRKGTKGAPIVRRQHTVDDLR